MKRRLLIIAALYGVACLNPTEMTVTITTDIPCDQLKSVQVIVGGDGAELETNALSAETTSCNNGKVGTVVILPNQSAGSAVFSVVVGVGVSTETCRKSSYESCVVARRSLRFIDHTPLALPVDLAERCVGQSCRTVGGALGTCLDGRCVPANVGNPSACSRPGDCGDPYYVPYSEAAKDASEYALGYGVQTHMFWAERDGREWFLYFNPSTPNIIKARAAAPNRSWDDAGSIDLGPGNTLAEGYGFGAAYAFINGVDVVHVVANVQSAVPFIRHLRLTISNGVLTATMPPTDIPSTVAAVMNCPNDGPTTLVTKTGEVYDASAWVVRNGQCDNNILHGTVDDGTNFLNTFQLDGDWNAQSYTYSHQLLDLPGRGRIMSGWGDHESIGGSTAFQVIAWATSDTFAAAEQAHAPTIPSDELFYGNGNGYASTNDWSFCRVRDDDVHVIRHVLDSVGGPTGAFEELRWNGATWSVATPPPKLAGVSNTGLVLLTDGDPNDGMVIAALANDNYIHTFRWTESAGWGHERTFTTDHIHSLSGSGCGRGHPLFGWTTGSAAPYSLLVADAQGLFIP